MDLNPKKIALPRKRGYVTNYRKGTYEAKYWYDGEPKRRKLKATNRDEAFAETQRLFTEWLLLGASYNRPAYKPKKSRYNPDLKYIHIVKSPVRVNIVGGPKKHFKTLDQARRFRDRWLAEHRPPPPPREFMPPGTRCPRSTILKASQDTVGWLLALSCGHTTRPSKPNMNVIPKTTMCPTCWKNVKEGTI